MTPLCPDFVTAHLPSLLGYLTATCKYFIPVFIPTQIQGHTGLERIAKISRPKANGDNGPQLEQQRSQRGLTQQSDWPLSVSEKHRDFVTLRNRDGESGDAKICGCCCAMTHCASVSAVRYSTGDGESGGLDGVCVCVVQSVVVGRRFPVDDNDNNQQLQMEWIPSPWRQVHQVLLDL